LQTIRIALAIQLKEEMGIDNILQREHEINANVFSQLKGIDNLHLFAEEHQDRIGVFSFYIDNLHFNLGVKLLNDRFGIQTRGGCSCAGTYGHYLLHIDSAVSEEFRHKIVDEGCLIEKPGWIRMSVHPTMTDEEITYVCDSIKSLANNFNDWSGDYTYNPVSNEFEYNKDSSIEKKMVEEWFAN